MSLTAAERDALASIDAAAMFANVEAWAGIHSGSDNRDGSGGVADMKGGIAVMLAARKALEAFLSWPSGWAMRWC